MAPNGQIRTTGPQSAAKQRGTGGVDRQANGSGDNFLQLAAPEAGNALARGGRNLTRDYGCVLCRAVLTLACFTRIYSLLPGRSYKQSGLSKQKLFSQPRAGTQSPNASEGCASEGGSVSGRCSAE